MRKRTVFISFLPLVHNHVQVIWVRARIPPRCSLPPLNARVTSGAFRRLHRLSQSARTHITHRMRVRTQITWTWLCTRGKNDINTVRFLYTNRSFRVLGHQCVVTMENCLIWISLCMFFFPLIETVTYTCHYMTDRLERFDLKISKLDLLKKKRNLHLGCPWGSGSQTFLVTPPFKPIKNLAPPLPNPHPN